ncbi:hypothetical protein [Saccharopolyspora sp. 5N708]|uniref:hypothetical protein n=1 Tax=Saccharopolyspora sp. 5N708 TaxID=3457424 RepID=UPI003FD32D01
MASETYLNAPGVEDAARELATVAGQFGDAVNGLKQALARDEGCWSDDKIGNSFAQTYVGPAQQTQQGLTDLGDSLGEFANEGLPGTVRLIKEVDSEYGEVLNKYGSQLDEFGSQID